MEATRSASQASRIPSPCVVVGCILTGKDIGVSQAAALFSTIVHFAEPFLQMAFYARSLGRVRCSQRATSRAWGVQNPGSALYGTVRPSSLTRGPLAGISV